jgi:hypothetical protein
MNAVSQKRFRQFFRNFAQTYYGKIQGMVFFRFFIESLLAIWQPFCCQKQAILALCQF